MLRGSWVIVGVMASSAACDRDAPTEPAPAEAKLEGPAEPTPVEAAPIEAAPAKGTVFDEAPMSREPERFVPRHVTPVAPIAPAPMSREEPEPIVLRAPPLDYTLVAAAPITQGPQPKLVQRSAKKNAIIDSEAWFIRNKLALPLWGSGFGASGDPLPPEIPATFQGEPLSWAIRGVGCSLAIYQVAHANRRLVVRDDAGDTLAALDFSAYGHVPDDGGSSEQQIHWVQRLDDVLFVSTSHMGYASDSGGHNAYITALELRTGELLWRSEPLVSNSHDFIVHDGWIVTGYGFTAEPDFLFVLDGKTGAVAQKLKVKSGPEVIVERDGTIFVRTYDRDYEFVARTK